MTTAIHLDYFLTTIARLRDQLDDLERCALNLRTEAPAPTAPTVHPSAQLLTTEQAAALLAVRTDTVSHWKSERRLPAIGHGRGVRYRLSDVQRFQDERERESAARRRTG